MTKTRRIRAGRAEKLCGGYVSWDARKRDRHGDPVRTTRELHVWVPAGLATDDCGAGTAALVAALVAKAGARTRVACRECWDC
jgi:hypothetical protein